GCRWLRLGEETTGRCHHVDAVPGLELARQVPGHAAVVVDPHADPQVTVVGRAADRVSATHLLSADVRTHADVLTWKKAISVAQRFGHFERDAQRVAALGTHVGYFERMKGQHGFKCI